MKRLNVPRVKQRKGENMTDDIWRRWVEERATELRELVDLPPLAPLNPRVLAEAMGARVIYPDDIPRLSVADRRQLSESGRNDWSGGTIALPDGRIKIVLNPLHSKTRLRATLMEELAHVHLRHKPSQLLLIDGELVTRSYDRKQEQEAYSVGAAALITAAHLDDASQRSLDRQTLARMYGVSVELVAFRERMTQLQLCG